MKTAFVSAFLCIHIAIAYNFCLLSMETVLGNDAGNNLLVTPRYDFLRIPASDLAKQFGAVSRISADFSQLFFSVHDSYSTAYTSENRDPWRRPSRCAPLVHAVCHYTLCRLPYGYASLSHILIQLVLLYVSFLYAFNALRIRRYLLPCLLLANIILFLTPVGLSWFERGQFSLYVTLAYLWLFLGIIKRNPYHLALSAMFAFIKWTSFPLIFVALALWIINVAVTQKNLGELKHTLFLAAWIPLTLVLLFLFDIKGGLHFLQGLYIQEQTSHPEGLSLAILVPRVVAKSLPFMLVALGALYCWWKNNRDYLFLAPYLCAAGILSVNFPTLAYDYSTPCLLCFMPLLAAWAERTREKQAMASHDRDCISRPVFSTRIHLPHLALFLYGAFLLAASVFHSADLRVNSPARLTIFLYMTGAIIFMVISALQAGSKTESESAPSTNTQTPAVPGF